MKKIVMILCGGWMLFAMGCQGVREAFGESFGDEEAMVETDDPAGAAVNKKRTNKIEKVLSFHRIPADEKSAHTAWAPTAGSGELVLLEKMPFCHSRDIDQIKVVPSETRPGFYGLMIHLNEKGRRNWESFSGLTYGTRVALVMDGHFYRAFVVDKTFDSTHEEWAYLDVNLSQRLAQQIADAAERNHRHFSKKPMSLWGK